VTITNNGNTNTIYHPTNMGEGGRKHAVVIWGNGTGATPSSYNVLLRHWASHGFIAAAANTTMSGSGAQMLAGLDYLTTENGRAGSKFFGKVDLANVAASGHSQGGGGANAAGRNARVKTIMPIEGIGGAVRSGLTAIILSGTADEVLGYQSQRNLYNGLTVPAAYAQAAGVTHMNVNQSIFRPTTLAWMKWQLEGDAAARGHFLGANCGMCQEGSRYWTVYLTNARLQALP
jgi:hypothetical protein